MGQKVKPLTYQEVYDRMKALNMAVFDKKAWDMTLFGVRGHGRRQGANDFDDRIGVLFTDNLGVKHCLSYVATTDPGLTWLEKPGRPEGCAIMVADRQYRGAYIFGKHRGSYTALVQRGGDIDIVRDNDRDPIVDVEALVEAGEVESGRYGGNIHRAHRWNIQAVIALYSALCQVFLFPWDFQAFLTICEMQPHHGNGSSFSYALLNEWR